MLSVETYLDRVPLAGMIDYEQADSVAGHPRREAVRTEGFLIKSDFRFPSKTHSFKARSDDVQLAHSSNFSLRVLVEIVEEDLAGRRGHLLFEKRPAGDERDAERANQLDVLRADTWALQQTKVSKR